jgi:hypothetical protein
MHLEAEGNTIVFFGCESVNSRHIIGERISDDLGEKINGTWIAEDSALALHQVSPGEIRVAGVEWNDESNKFDVMELTLIVSRVGDDTIFNLVRSDEMNLAEQEIDGTWYQFIKFELGENEMTIRSISTDAFAKAVEAGTLKGRVDIKRNPDGQVSERHVWIEGDKTDFDRFIKSGNMDDLFDGEPATLRRLTDDGE